jgi:lysophospholipase L1-like esterase
MIDVSNAFHDTEKYLCVDGIHPNTAGQEKIAKTIARAIV